MKKIILTLAIGAILAVAGHYLLAPKCEEISQDEVNFAQQFCAQTINRLEFRERVCMKIHGSQECQLFEDTDKPIVERMFLDEINACVQKTFEKRNACMDKIEKL